ncbi:MAG: hypothetical protein ACFNYI_01955 [Eubacterium sp.]
MRRNIQVLKSAEVREEYGVVRNSLWKLIESTEAQKLFPSPDLFLAVSAILGCGVYFAAVWQAGWRTALAAGGSASALPYLLLRMKLESRRRVRSQEGLVMVQELLAQYRIRDGNIREAVFSAAESLEDAPNLRSVMYDLAKGLNQACTKKECRAETEKFRYAIGTVWGSALASAVYFAHVQGMNITHTLEDLAGSLERSRKVCEQARREHHESKLLLTAAVPGTYLWTVFCSLKYFDMTLKRFLWYQFRTPLGLKCILISAMLYITGICFQVFLNGEKLDLK